MNCQEVMEFMHRQLDGDLDASEKEVLMNHTRHCPDCAAMFERLKLLSAELTSLPKVVPSYSLVDAIMPELERIELLGQKEAVLTSPSTTAGTNMQSTARRMKRERRFPSIRAMAGVITAGIIAGLFVITYPPQSSKDVADKDAGYIASERSSATESAASDHAQILNMTTKNDNEGLPNEVGTHSFEPNGEDTGQFKSMETNNINRNRLDNTSDTLSTPAVMQGTIDSPRQYVKDQSGSPNEPYTGAAAMGGAVGEKAEPQDNSTGFSDSDSQQRTISPNGHYVASVKQYTVAIAAVGDNKQLIETVRKNGKHVNLAWSEDSLHLTYEVHLDQGEIEKYIIDVTSGQEKKAAH